KELLRVQLDDELLADGQRDVLARRQRLHPTLERFLGQLQPVGHAAALHRAQRVDDARDLARRLANLHQVVRPHQVRGNVDLATVELEVAGAHELPRLGVVGREAQTVDDVVEAPLEQLDEVLAGDALHPRRLVVVAAELALGDPVDALDFLLLAQLLAVVRRLLAARLAVLPRRIGPPLVPALVGVAAVALEEQLHVLAPAEPADWSGVTCHRRFPLYRLARVRLGAPSGCGCAWLQGRLHPRPPLARQQTRRRLGGRQPLCGMGVMSRMSVILKPAACKARSADSRPDPGPFTYTATLRMPCSCAFLAASSAASCAANGVDLREPLNPRTPADDQAMTLPDTSVMVTIVLLNVDWMWAIPDWTFFLTFFFVFGFDISVYLPSCSVRSRGRGAPGRFGCASLQGRVVPRPRSLTWRRSPRRRRLRRSSSASCGSCPCGGP